MSTMMRVVSVINRAIAEQRVIELSKQLCKLLWYPAINSAE